MEGLVYWITGLSGTGKTTLGKALYYRMRESSDRVVILDGNIIKGIMAPGEVLYTSEARKARAFQYARLCKLLSEQGMIVICCTVSLYHEVQEWNRKNIPNYIEIFMDVDVAVLHRANYRGLYPDKDAGQLQAEFPQNPDLVICNTMDEKTMDEEIDGYVDAVLRITPAGVHDTKAHKVYWDAYYKTGITTTEPSGFARFILPYLEQGGQLIDLGCGNGRDSIFFAQNGLKVTSVDLSESAIETVNRVRGSLPVFSVCDDFVQSKILFSVEYSYCYSRWTMHSIDEEQQAEMIDNVYNALKRGGLFFIEVRTVNDDIYGQGEPAGRDAFVYDDHYRRFLRPEEVLRQLEEKGFTIAFSQEGKGFSKTAVSDPTLLRVIAKKA